MERARKPPTLAAERSVSATSFIPALLIARNWCSMTSTHASIPKNPRNATKKWICNVATVNTNDATTPSPAQRTLRMAWLYKPDDETACANFLSVWSCSSSWLRIRCSSSESGTTSLFHEIDPDSTQGDLFFGIQCVAIVIRTPFGYPGFTARAQGAGRTDSRLTESTANVVNCPRRGSPHFV